jgi:predicted RNase H-like HicB family nuclease
MDDVILTAVIQELPANEGGGFWGFVEEIPGAISQGDTLDEVRLNLREAVALVLEYHREHAKESLDPAAVRTIREQIRISA